MSKLIRLTFLISLFLIFLLPPTDPDLGWQLRCGELFWQEGSFCENNQFSVLLEDYSWPNHAWGYQAIIYPIWSAFGGYGLTVFNAFLVTAAFGFLFAAHHRNCSSGLQSALAILATIYFGWGVFSFGIRSQLMGFFFFNLTLWLLTKWQEKPKLMFLLPAVMLLWANTHGSVILGLILIGVFNLTTVVVKRERILPLTVVAMISGLVTLINPFGFKIYEEMWRHFSGPIDLSKLIAEWVPPQPQIQQIILVSGVFVLIYLLSKFRTNPPFLLYSLFLILPFAFWALKARRNVPFYFVILSYTFLSSLEAKISPLRDQLAALLAAGLLLYGLLIQLPKTLEFDPCQRDVPCEAVEFLKGQEVGNIFNRYEWGGFLIWHLPEYKIFVDGRMPAWGKSVSPYTIYLHTLQTRQAGGQTQPGWQETLDQYDITYILISPNTFMDLKLREDPASFGWRELFRTKNSVVYRKL